MNQYISKSSVNDTFREISNFSFTEKKKAAHVLDVNSKEYDDLVNFVLDAINECSKDFLDKADRIDRIVKLADEMTWVDEPYDEEVLKAINDVISTSKELLSSLNQQYDTAVAFFIPRKICIKELETFKLAIDDLNESILDLDEIFFKIPSDTEFNEITKRLVAKK